MSTKRWNVHDSFAAINSDANVKSSKTIRCKHAESANQTENQMRELGENRFRTGTGMRSTRICAGQISNAFFTGIPCSKGII